MKPNNAAPKLTSLENDVETRIDGDTVLDQLRHLLASEFEIEPNLITPTANLFEDLDIDSIDAIDMLARLRQLTGKELPADELKTVLTVGDVVALVDAH